MPVNSILLSAVKLITNVTVIPMRETCLQLSQKSLEVFLKPQY